MGQKINPNGSRVGAVRDWTTKWYTDKNFAGYFDEDLRIRKYIEKRLADASVSAVEIERTTNRVNVSIHTARPGMVIGKGSPEVEALHKELNKLTGKRVHINVVEIKRPNLDARLAGESIARRLGARTVSHRAIRGTIQRAMHTGTKGTKTQAVGRLNGADMLRIKSYSDDTAPLHTLHTDIDYSRDEASTTYGALGIKTWAYRGGVLPTKKNSNNDEQGGK